MSRIDPELLALAEQAVVYGLPVYEMARMRAATSPQRVEPFGQAPPPERWCNVFVHARKLLGAGKSRVVTPNNDTLYTHAWLDLRHGPLVIDVPDTAGRYYVLGMLDFFTNPFAHLGARLTGTSKRSFLITPPGWSGDLPEAFSEPGAHVPSPTPWVWVLGRLLVDGPSDLDAVHSLQDGFSITALSDWLTGAPGTPLSFDPLMDPKAEMSAEYFAAQVNSALRENPAPPSDNDLLARFSLVGIGPGAQPLNVSQAAALQQALNVVAERLRDGAEKKSASGWTLPPMVRGSFGNNYEDRARIAFKYIGMLESAEAMYPLAWHDGQGRALSGAHRYRLRFEPGLLPPVDAFWSVTMYDARDYMLVDNPIQRFALGDRTEGLQKDPDGGLSLYLQHERPALAEEQANWLPAPAGDFYVCLRAYMPRANMLDGQYTLPSIERLDNPTAV